MALRETGDGNLVHLLQLLDEGADSGAVPMPASCQFGNGDYKLPVGQAELLLAQILGDVLYRSLVYKVKVGFDSLIPDLSFKNSNRDIRSDILPELVLCFCFFISIICLVNTVVCRQLHYTKGTA